MDDFDEVVNAHPDNCEFDTVVEQALTRRGFLGGVLAMGGVATLGRAVPPSGAQAVGNRFAFDAVAASTADEIVVPVGYKAETVIRWADPIWSDSVAFDQETRDTAETQARTFGDNTDGMEIFMHADRTLMAINNENTNRKITWRNRPVGKFETDDDVEKGMLAHGVSVVELAHNGNRWNVVIDSPFNRRITPRTEMAVTGQAAGHDLLKTAIDPNGTTTLSTWNNCGSGNTPWGTYLACEENFNVYFSAEDENHEASAELRRYGVSASDWGYGWANVVDCFDVAKNPNEPNRAGYVVEIDPRDPKSTPKKRTALGRFKHENAECVVNNDGRLVIYMGDDERGEFSCTAMCRMAFMPLASTPMN